jgi:hypothetical protein
MSPVTPSHSYTSFQRIFIHNSNPGSETNSKMTVGPQDQKPNPSLGEEVQYHGFNGMCRDCSIDLCEKSDETKSSNTKDLKSQSCELPKYSSNHQGCQSQPQNDQNKTTKTNKRNCRHQNAAANPPLPKKKKQLQKTKHPRRDGPVERESLYIRLGCCCMSIEFDLSSYKKKFGKKARNVR